MAKHNKKRNVGLIHEQIVRYASERVVDGEEDKTKKAISILSSRFREGTELYKEFRLFNSLVHTNVSNKDIARRIIVESKAACQNHDFNKLKTEKSGLIKNINHDLDDQNFYSRHIPEYRVFATVQALLNEWRGASRLSPSEVVKYETFLEEWLTRGHLEEALTKKSDADPLALKIMIEKFNKKYSKHLNRNQTNLLERKLLNDDSGLISCISEIKKHANLVLENFYNDCNNDVLNKKKTRVESQIQSMEINTSDTTVRKALTLSSLIEELENNND